VGTASPLAGFVVAYYCRNYYKAVRVGGGALVVYYCRTLYKAVRTGGGGPVEEPGA
jgi:hypothetical protein